MSNTILIVGSHPIRQNIVNQYETLGCDIEMADDITNAQGKDYREICILPPKGVDDHDILQAMETFSKAYPETPSDQSKPLCHLLLHDNVTLWLLQTINLYPEIHKKFELYAFTMEDQWAKNVFCGMDRNIYPPLDREKINGNSNKIVHLVIAGFSELGESLAIHAALIAHFPNYVRNQALRTRITIVDKDLAARKDAYIQRYANLFEHSYYRCIDLSQRCMTLYHEPIYHASREDFVDVEWEFVEGDLYDPAFQHKLQLWGESKDQLLTLALCDNDSNSNFHRAFGLPKCIYQNGITVFVATERSGMLEKVREADDYHNLYPIGMNDCGYDVGLPLLQMAKRLNYFYKCSYGQEGVPTDMPTEKVEEAWRHPLRFNVRNSSLYNVMTIPTKMRSLGHEEKDWDKFFALTQEEVETLSAVEHNRWSVERLIGGFRPPTNTERDEIRKNIETFITAKETGKEMPEKDLKNIYKKRKIHYDLCSYRELREDKTGQNVRLYDYDLIACIPLIAQSFKETQQ